MTGVYLARDVREASALAELLLENGIDSYSQENETGEFLKVTADFSALGTRLFVEDEDAQKAKTIIASEIARSKRENPNGELGDAFGHKEWPHDYKWRVITGAAIGVIVVLILILAHSLL